MFLLERAGSTDLFKGDGVLVTSQGEARTVSAVWQLVVLITPPTRPPIESWISDIQDCVDKLTASEWFDNINHWDRKLEIISARLEQDPVETQQVSLSRRRRGLFNFVGAGASWLFGTVTQEQLDTVQEALTANSLGTQALKHNQEQMLSVMNKTRTMQVKLAEHMVVVERLTKIAIEEAEEMESTMSDVLLLGKIRIAVEEIESVVMTFVDQKAQHHRAVMQLERGMLTEDLINKKTLATVLTKARIAGFEPLSVHWYYQYTEVRPVWGRDATIAFSVGLQMVGHDRYMVYGLDYLPVVFDKDHLRTVMGESMVAVGTRTRTSFYPKTCIGRLPLVCLPSMEFTRQTCEAALSTGTKPEECSIRISKKGRRSATVLAPKEGSRDAVIAPHERDITVQIRCVGKPQSIIRLNNPTVLELPEACYLGGEGWLLKGMMLRQESMNIRRVSPVIDLPPLNISWPATLHPKMLEQMKNWNELHVPLMSFEDIVPIPESYVKQEHFSIFWYSVVAAVVIVLIVFILYVAYRCRMYGMRTRRSGRTVVRSKRLLAVKRGDLNEMEETKEAEIVARDVIVPLSIQNNDEISELPGPPLNRDTMVKYTPRTAGLEIVDFHSE